MMEKNQENNNQNKKLIALDGLGFMQLELKQRELILHPFLPQKGITMISAKRGVGKTHLSLSIALSVAIGKDTLDGKWKVDKAWRVLFVDGEMATITLQERLKLLLASLGAELPEGYLKIIAQDMQEMKFPDLSTKEGQGAIEEHLEDIDLIIFDNLSSLFRSGRENESESWTSIQEWLLDLRRREKSVLLIHHAGKNGSQRGNSKKEDVMDSTILLKQPKDYKPSQGARFEVHYDKARSFAGSEAEAFIAHLVSDENSQRWQVTEINGQYDAEVLELHEQGLSYRKIAEQLGTNKNKVADIINSRTS